MKNKELTQDDIEEIRREADHWLDRGGSWHGASMPAGQARGMARDVLKMIDYIKALEKERDNAQRERREEMETTNASLSALNKLHAKEMADLRAVADPDNVHPELSLRDLVMHLGEQAALLASVNQIAERRGQERDVLAAKLEEVTRELSLENSLKWDWYHAAKAAQDRAEQAERELATNMAEYHRTYAAAIDRAEQAERQLSTVVRDVRLTAEGDIYNAEQERDEALRSWADAANERDEALAEVERLRGLLADACRRIDWMAGSNDITNRLRREGGLKITKETP